MVHFCIISAFLCAGGDKQWTEQQESVCRDSQQHARGNLIYIWVLCISNNFFFALYQLHRSKSNLCAVLYCLTARYHSPPPPADEKILF